MKMTASARLAFAQRSCQLGNAVSRIHRSPPAACKPRAHRVQCQPRVADRLAYAYQLAHPQFRQLESLLSGLFRQQSSHFRGIGFSDAEQDHRLGQEPAPPPRARGGGAGGRPLHPPLFSRLTPASAGGPPLPLRGKGRPPTRPSEKTASWPRPRTTGSWRETKGSSRPQVGHCRRRGAMVGH